jgi:O-antigen ligase
LLRDETDILTFFRGITLMTALVCLGVIVYFYSSKGYQNIFEGHKALITTYDEEVAGVIRVDRVSGWPTAFGTFLAISLMFSLSLFTMVRNKFEKAFYLSISLLILNAIIFTFSRTSYFVAGLALLTWALLQNSWKKKIMITGMLVILVASVLHFFPNVPDMLGYMGSFQVRLEILEYMLSKVDAVDLLLGHGFQSFIIITQGYSTESLMGHWIWELTSHNEYLKVFLKSGIFGFFLFALVLWFILKSVWSLAEKELDKSKGYVFFGWFCALGPLYLSLFVFEGLHYWPIAGIFWMLSGSLSNFRRRNVRYRF